MQAMGTMRRGRIITGVVGVVLSLGYTALAWQLPMGKPNAPSAGVFPVVVGIFVFVISAGMVVESLVSAKIEGSLNFPRGRNLVLVLVFLGSTIVLALALPFLGLFVSSLLYMLLMVRILAIKKGWLVPVIVSAVMSVIVCLVFVGLLNVPLDVFPFGLGG